MHSSATTSTRPTSSSPPARRSRCLRGRCGCTAATRSSSGGRGLERMPRFAADRYRSQRHGCVRPVQGRPSRRAPPWSLQVLRLEGDRITEFTFFLDVARMFPCSDSPLIWTERSLTRSCPRVALSTDRRSLSGSLSTATTPPWADTAASTIDRPSPCRRDGGTVTGRRKNRSVTRSATSAGMPWPSSSTESATDAVSSARIVIGTLGSVCTKAFADDVGNHLAGGPRPRRSRLALFLRRR